MEKLCYNSMVTFGDDGVHSGDLTRISMADSRKWSKRASEYERKVKDMPIDLFQEVMDHLACADSALSAPHDKDIYSLATLAWADGPLVSLIAHM